ncbi:24135_t:CDS:2, partial [Gigaspora margarita]
MSRIKHCEECQATESTKFRSLKDENLVVNPLKKGSKHIKTVEEEEDICEEEMSMKINLSEAIKMMAKIFYKREHVEKEAPIYDLNEILKDLFDQLYLAAQPLECNEQTMERMKKLMVFICYLLSSLNNTRINAFNSYLAYYLDSASTSNEGLNMMANLGASITLRAVNRKKRRMSDVHGEYIERALANYSENALVLNIDDYHNIHVLRKPDSTSTSWAAHMAMIIANPCPILAIPCNRAINPKIADDRLIIKHLDERFIVNLGIPYHDCNWYKDSEFQQHFMTSKKYPYTPKQLNTLSQKCVAKLLDMFAKIYQAHHRHSSIIQTSSDGINTYKLTSLGYEITDRYLPHGFVTNWKPYATILCDYVYCYNSSSIDGYLQGEIKKNIDALLTSLMKEEKNPIKDDSKNIVKDNSKIDEMTDNSKTVEDSLERATESFLKS